MMHDSVLHMTPCPNQECKCTNCDCDPCNCTEENPCGCEEKDLGEIRGGQ